jgi:hypothetical protein
MTPHLLALLLLDAGAPASPSAIEVSEAWLVALARADAAAIRRLSALPLVIEGFQYNARADENLCNRVPGMKRNPKTKEIRVSAETEAQLGPVLECVFADEARREWTKDRVRPTLKQLAHPRESSRRLARYRQRPLLATHTIVQAVKSLDGVTVSALLALRRQDASLTVEACYLDFLFEE